MPELSRRGKHKLKSLREHGGKSALATVIEFHKRWGIPESAHGIPMGHSEHYKLRIRVEPRDEPSFEAELKEHDFFMFDSDEPRPGDQFAVVYDPEDHSEVMRDPYDADSLMPRTEGKLDLKPAEQDRFRATLYANLEKLRANGQLSDQQYLEKRAQLEADFGPPDAV
jgi:hypothetical protein